MTQDNSFILFGMNVEFCSSSLKNSPFVPLQNKVGFTTYLKAYFPEKIHLNLTVFAKRLKIFCSECHITCTGMLAAVAEKKPNQYNNCMVTCIHKILRYLSIGKIS